jgi:hypothetical protein
MKIKQGVGRSSGVEALFCSDSRSENDGELDELPRRSPSSEGGSGGTDTDGADSTWRA